MNSRYMQEVCFYYIITLYTCAIFYIILHDKLVGSINAPFPPVTFSLLETAELSHMILVNVPEFTITCFLWPVHF
jgi:hypothetical protein